MGLTLVEVLKKAKPILITGSHRAGTTWVGKMLCISDNSVYFNEPFNIGHIHSHLEFPLQYWFSYIPDTGNVERFYMQYKKILNFETSLEDNTFCNLNFRIRRNLLVKIKSINYRLQGKVPIVKDPIALLSAELLCQKFDMNVVCMIRHPLAFCGSIKKWNWTFPFSHFTKQSKLMDEVFFNYRDVIYEFSKKDKEIVEQAILLWNLFHYVIKKYCKYNKKWIFLKHEDVVNNAKTIFEDIYQRLGLKFTDKCVRMIDDYSKSNTIDPSHPSFRARDKHSVLNTWRNRLSTTEIKMILKNTEELRHYFYPDKNNGY